MDLIKCINCDFVGAIKTGEDICPNCNKVGFLSWLDKGNQELDGLYNKILNCDCIDGLEHGKAEDAKQNEYADEEDVAIFLHRTALKTTNAETKGIGAPSEEIKEAVDYVTVEPSNGTRNIGKDDAVGDKLIDFVHIEAFERPTMQRLELLLNGIGHRLALADIYIGGEKDGTDGNDNAGASHIPVEMDVVGLTIGTHKMTEGNETGHTGDYGQEDERQGHGQRSLMGRMVCVEFLVFSVPENVIIKTEHIEGRHGGNGGHEPTHEGTVGEAGGEDFVFGEET